jgi:hypothetical protein
MKNKKLISLLAELLESENKIILKNKSIIKIEELKNDIEYYSLDLFSISNEELINFINQIINQF